MLHGVGDAGEVELPAREDLHDRRHRLLLALPVVLRIRVSPLVLLTLYFLHDLSGARATLEGVPTTIGYGAHVGGYLFGLAIGYGSGLFRDGARESLAVQGERFHG